ncbi:MAG: hypothetical protein AAFW00_25615 [Bacteroidota bacterium]
MMNDSILANRHLHKSHASKPWSRRFDSENDDAPSRREPAHVKPGRLMMINMLIIMGALGILFTALNMLATLFGW